MCEFGRTMKGQMAKRVAEPVSQRIWTPRGFGPPGPNPLADLDPPGPYPLADLDPLRGFGPPHKTFLFSNLF